MKAKEYYKQFLEAEKENGEVDAILEMVGKFFKEVEGIMKMRNANSNSALISILKEQNLKWNALRKFDERFKFNGFIEYTKHKMPFLINQLN